MPSDSENDPNKLHWFTYTDQELRDHAAAAAPEPVSRGAEIAEARDWLAGENQRRRDEEQAAIRLWAQGQII